jgi:MFS family permease
VLLPWLARTPAQLAAANVAATVSENGAALIGPALAGLVLFVADPITALFVAAGVLVLTFVALTRVDAPRQVSVSRPGSDGRRALSATRSLLRLGPTGGVVALVFAQTFTRGALGVLLVLLALDTLGLQDSSVGWLNAAIGLGGLAGAAVGSRVVRVSRLARCMVVGILLWGVGTAALAGAPGLALAMLALTVVGVGNALEDSGLFTLVPRRLGPREAAAGLGAVEVAAVVGIAAGALLSPVLAEALGVREAIAGIGGVLIALVLAYGAPLARLDGEEAGPSPDLELVRGLPAFSVLPVVVLEELAGALTEEHYPTGATVVEEGAPGDRFEVVREGRAAVHVRGVERRVLGPGDGFGEIALLRDVPRTATVTALSDLTTLALERSDFLGALSTTPTSRAHADAGAEEKLGGDP